MSLPVQFDLQPCEHGGFIGIATLNKPAALNAIDLEMVNLLLVQLQAWQNNNEVHAVFMDARGDKAFCAGGDVVSMHQAMSAKNPNNTFGHHDTLEAIPDMLLHFFSQEYRLDFLIHTYNKPIVLWGNGIIMGGGLGLMAGASHRIVTSSSRIAMPEVSIGLFPDVGGSYFLNKMPKGCGRFLGMTGASIDAADAIFLELADHLMDHEQKPAVVSALKSIEWEYCAAENANKITRMCKNFAVAPSAPGPVQTHQTLLADLASEQTLEGFVAAIRNLKSEDDKWLSKAKTAMEYGSPITQHLVQQQLLRASNLALANCFKMELIMACRCATFGEFQEGVRALLIDKDRTPKWAYKNVDVVDPQVIDTFFQSPWQNTTHPLHDLGIN